MIKIVHTLKEGFVMGCLTASEEEWVKNFDTKKSGGGGNRNRGRRGPRGPKRAKGAKAIKVVKLIGRFGSMGR